MFQEALTFRTVYLPKSSKKHRDGLPPTATGHCWIGQASRLALGWMRPWTGRWTGSDISGCWDESGALNMLVADINDKEGRCLFLMVGLDACLESKVSLHGWHGMCLACG